ncbi:hypothetical protein B0T21DRAFT_343815 [Apiosordaria backusii]|uniref:Uncharacterized protein n=1 Tax=Apiosordaria backusii TaxID=314023 RepID=A0AA40EYY0_9PEZI|nr:hypothetical protein B0T21DRAFT_343815 [Apiosordaria backusii]
MPSIAQETTTSSPSSVPCKKRRRDDDRDNNQQFTLYASILANSTAAATNNAVYSSHIYPDNHQHHHHHGSSLLPLATTRKMIPLPLSKRQRMTSVDTVEIEIDQHDEATKRQQQYHDVAPNTNTKSPTREQSPAKQQDQPRPTLGTRSSTTSSSASALMSRCHICFRKPSKKSDLDSFADCQGCGQRTCYVCIRECLGWSPTSQQQQQPQQRHQPPSLQTEPSFTMIDVDSEEAGTGDRQPPQTDSENNGWAKGGGGHRKMVCSRCCVERGADGDVVCLGCLPFVEG